MDRRIIHSLKEIFCRKIMLYDDLLHCFKKEKDSLINIDLDKLWEISQEKEKICSKIESLRQEISVLLDPDMDQDRLNLGRILNLIPTPHEANFRRLYRTLLRLKNEVEIRRKENMSFIDESLQFLDEMISIIAGETKPKITYDDKCHLSKPGPTVLISREA